MRLIYVPSCASLSYIKMQNFEPRHMSWVAATSGFDPRAMSVQAHGPSLHMFCDKRSGILPVMTRLLSSCSWASWVSVAGISRTSHQFLYQAVFSTPDVYPSIAEHPFVLLPCSAFTMAEEVCSMSHARCCTQHDACQLSAADYCAMAMVSCTCMQFCDLHQILHLLRQAKLPRQ